MALRPVRWHVRVGRVVVGVLALCAFSCDDPSDDGNPATPYLLGRVTDATGAPVAGVPVSLAYKLEGWTPPDYCNPAGRAHTIAVTAVFTFDLETPAFVDITILDYMRRRIRTLLQGNLPAGRHSIVWNGTDDAGRRVPAGMYFAPIEITQAMSEWREERKLFVYFCSREENLEAPQAMTDASGSYRIELALLPIGETFEAFDEGGGSIGLASVDDSLHVQAGVAEGATWRSTSSGVHIADRSRDLRVDLVLP